MALTTDNQKLAIMEWGSIWESGLPLSPAALGQDDQQQLLWDNPDPVWGTAAIITIVGTLIYTWPWDKWR